MVSETRVFKITTNATNVNFQMLPSEDFKYLTLNEPTLALGLLPNASDLKLHYQVPSDNGCFVILISKILDNY